MDVNLDKLYEDFDKEYKVLSSLSRISTPYIKSNLLVTTNSPYKEVTSEFLNNFFRIYMSTFYGKYASCYQLNHSNEEIKEFNDLIKQTLNKNQSIGLAIYSYTYK